MGVNNPGTNNNTFTVTMSYDCVLNAHDELSDE
jgi:hypothetical protein